MVHWGLCDVYQCPTQPFQRRALVLAVVWERLAQHPGIQFT
jgi:hypothetical protein